LYSAQPGWIVTGVSRINQRKQVGKLSVVQPGRFEVVARECIIDFREQATKAAQQPETSTESYVRSRHILCAEASKPATRALPTSVPRKP
jgi:hypothetical protein